MEKWNAYPEASPVCTKLSMIPPIIGNKERNFLEKFIITMYDRSSQDTDIDAVRLEMFARKQRLYDTIPPTRYPWFNILDKIRTKQAAFEVSQHYVKYTLKGLLVNGIGSSKIAHGK